MKRLFLWMVLTVLAAPMAIATTNYINIGSVSAICPPQAPPQIDASNFVNHGTFSITNNNIDDANLPWLPPAPFETWNTRNWTNFNKMVCDPGFRFDYFDSAGQTNGWSANFRNAGQVNETNATIFGSDFVLISATNIVNRGTVVVSGAGVLTMTGKDVDLTRGTLGGTGNDTNDQANTLDYYWNVGGINFYSNVFNTIFDPNYFYTPTQIVQKIDYLPAPAHYANVLNSLLLTNGTPLQPPGYTAYVTVTPDAYNPYLAHTDILFMSQPNPSITTEVRFRPAYAFTGGSFPNGPYWFQNTKTIRFQSVLTNRSTGALTTNNLYLIDTNNIYVNGNQSTFSPALLPTVRPYLPPPPYVASTFRPSNYGITHVYPTFGIGDLITATNFDFTILADWNLLIPEWSTSYGALITPNPFSFDRTLYGATWTNMPGRLEIRATKSLNLERTIVDGESYLVLQCTNHFIGSTNARIIAPFSDIDLATTNGTLRIANLIAPTVPRMCGEIDVWSGLWNTHLTVSVTPALVTSNVFNVMVVDSHLQQQVPSQIKDLTLRSTNLFISDALNVFSNLLIDATSLTITTNAANAPTPNGELNLTSGNLTWSASLPRLANLTNYGKISSANSIFFGGARVPPWFSGAYDEPYQSFVTHGLLMAQGDTIWAQYFEASGTNDAGVGLISVQANSAIVTNGAFLATDEISITSGDLLISNQVLTAGSSITLTVTNRLDDGSLSNSVDVITNRNIWTVGGGINLLRLPTNGASLLATTVTNTAFFNGEVNNTWAGTDSGNDPLGFVNNAALGRLILDGRDGGSLFAFFHPDATNALYVDLLELKGVTATNVDDVGNFIGIFLQAGFTIYYGDAVSNGRSIAEQINGRYGFTGADGGRFLWVSNYNTGFFSSTNVTYTDGTGIHRLNRALVTSCTIDSNGNGTPNCLDPNPVPVSTPGGLGLKAVYTRTPVRSVVLSWNTLPRATNYLYGSWSLPPTTNWQLLTQFVWPPALGTRVTKTNAIQGNGPLYYRVGVLSP
jgi:hypothetical protein